MVIVCGVVLSQSAQTAVDCNSGCRLKELQGGCLQTLETQRMPSLRNEEYRYTDFSLLLRTDPQVNSPGIDVAAVGLCTWCRLLTRKG